MQRLAIDENKIKYHIREKIKVRDITIDVPAIYKGKALTALFPISSAKAKEIINHVDICPAEIFIGKCLLCITEFDFRWSPVGPYTELVFSIPIFYKSKIKISTLPLLLNKYFKNFGFYVIDIAQSTNIAIEHGNLLTGYPHNPNTINVNFNEYKDYINIKSEGVANKNEILDFEIEKVKREKYVKETYMTYYLKNQKVYKIQMDIYGIGGSTRISKFNLGNHALALLVKNLGITPKSIQTRYFREVIEVNPVTKVVL